MERHVCGEITYESSEGTVHSDVCANFVDGEFIDCECGCLRKYMHSSLNEWLNKSGGTGMFHIGGKAVYDND